MRLCARCMLLLSARARCYSALDAAALRALSMLLLCALCRCSVRARSMLLCARCCSAACAVHAALRAHAPCCPASLAPLASRLRAVPRHAALSFGPLTSPAHRALLRCSHPPLHSVVLPGDPLATLPADARVRIGPGVRRDGAALVAAKAGVVRAKGAGTVWIDSTQRRVRRGLGGRTHLHCQRPPNPCERLRAPPSPCVRASSSAVRRRSGRVGHRHRAGARRRDVPGRHWREPACDPVRARL